MHGMPIKPCCRTTNTCPCTLVQFTMDLPNHNAPHRGQSKSNTDIPSRSFGSKQQWHFKTNEDLLTFFNSKFPLPTQNYWLVCQPTSAIATHVISVLRMMPFTLEDWRQLPAAGKSIGTTGKPTRHLWEWTLIYRIPNFQKESACSQDLWHGSELDSMVKENKSKIAQSVRRLRPLARRLHWSATQTQQK